MTEHAIDGKTAETGRCDEIEITDEMMDALSEVSMGIYDFTHDRREAIGQIVAVVLGLGAYGGTIRYVRAGGEVMELLGGQR